MGHFRTPGTSATTSLPISGILASLSQGNRDPADCFGSDDPEGWFDDPFRGGRGLPPKPPVPPL